MAPAPPPGSRVAVAAARNSEELQIGWQSGKFQVLGRTTRSEVRRRRRNPELHRNTLIFVAMDQAGEVRAWEVLADAREIRSESPDAKGNLRGSTLQRSSAVFLVPVPKDAAITKLRIYSPNIAAGVRLDLLAELALPAAK